MAKMPQNNIPKMIQTKQNALKKSICETKGILKIDYTQNSSNLYMVQSLFYPTPPVLCDQKTKKRHDNEKKNSCQRLD